MRYVCKNRRFPTIEAALAYANSIYKRTGVIAGIERIA